LQIMQRAPSGGDVVIANYLEPRNVVHRRALFYDIRIVLRAETQSQSMLRNESGSSRSPHVLTETLSRRTEQLRLPSSSCPWPCACHASSHRPCSSSCRPCSSACRQREPKRPSSRRLLHPCSFHLCSSACRQRREQCRRREPGQPD